MSARRSAPASTIYAGYGNSDVTRGLDTMQQRVTAFMHLQATRLLQYSSVRATLINHRPFETSTERRCSGHTWSVTARSCPSGAEGAAHGCTCQLLIVSSAYKVALKCQSYYTVNHKKRDILFLTITLANLNRFS